MWDWANRHWWWCCFVPETLQKHPNQSLLITSQNDAVCSNCISFSSVARMFASWLNRRRRRYLILIICSPVLIPLIFATCPFICAAEIWWFLCRKRRRWAGGGGAGDGCISAVDGGGDEVGLMQRYLEDQLMLVVGSVYECGDGDGDIEDEDGVDVEYLHSARPLLQ